MARIDVDMSDAKPEMGGQVLPEGQYLAKIVESDWKETKAGTGQYMQFKLQVCQGQYTGCPLFVRLNLKNRNDTTVRMAKNELACIVKALGVYNAEDTQQYHNIPMKVDVVCKRRDDQPDKFTNEIRAYHSRNASPANAEQAPQDAPHGARDDGPGERPW